MVFIPASSLQSVDDLRRSHCRHPAIYAGVCVEHIQRPIKHRLSRQRWAKIDAATQTVVEYYFPLGQYVAHPRMVSTLVVALMAVLKTK